VLALGYAIMVPFVAFGIFADFLKNVAISTGPLVASQTGFVAWQREVIAFSYQIGALIFVVACIYGLMLLSLRKGAITPQ